MSYSSIIRATALEYKTIRKRVLEGINLEVPRGIREAAAFKNQLVSDYGTYLKVAGDLHKMLSDMGDFGWATIVGNDRRQLSRHYKGVLRKLDDILLSNNPAGARGCSV